MAERRMFAKTIIDSDAFLDMPTSSQLLYFHLGMRADDDGFINKPKSIMRMCNCTEDDMKVLISKKFIIPFESGVVVVKHWKIHNTIRKDMYHETKYKEEKAVLELDENKAYTKVVTSTLQPCNEYVTNTVTQVRLGKDSIGKDRLDYSHTQGEVRGCGKLKNVYLTDEQYEELSRLVPYQCDKYINKFGRYKAMKDIQSESDYAWILGWIEEDGAVKADHDRAEAEKWDAVIDN